jgi:hypothetical protein
MGGAQNTFTSQICSGITHIFGPKCVSASPIIFFGKLGIGLRAGMRKGMQHYFCTTFKTHGNMGGARGIPTRYLGKQIKNGSRSLCFGIAHVSIAKLSFTGHI